MPFSSPPHQAFASPKAMLYPTANQASVTTQVMEKHCMRTESTFFVRTRPA